MGNINICKIIRTRFFIAGGLIPAFLAMLACLWLVWGGAALAQNLSRGYASDDPGVRPGMVVALSQASTAETPVVERAAPQTLDRVVGIATQPAETLVALGSGQHQVYVQTSGTVDAFISDMNGEVKKGDKVTVSPLKGVLMLASAQSSSVGAATEDLLLAGGQPQTIDTPEGEKTVSVAKSKIEFTRASAAEAPQNANKSALQKLGEAVTGKEVSDLQVVAALVIFLVVMIAEGSIIYGAVSSAMTSVGRNPLSKDLIRGELLRVLALTITVLLVGLASIYIILNI